MIKSSISISSNEGSIEAVKGSGELVDILMIEREWAYERLISSTAQYALSKQEAIAFGQALIALGESL